MGLRVVSWEEHLAMVARAGGAMPWMSNDFSWFLVMSSWASALVKYFIYSKNLPPFLKFYIAFILYLSITGMREFF